MHECMTGLTTNLYSKQPEFSFKGYSFNSGIMLDKERTMLHKGIVSYLYNDTTSEVAISGIYVLIY